MTYTTIWCRPGPLDYHYTGPYGTADGSSYANAIAGLMNVTWTTPKLQVIVAGVHIKKWNSSTPAVATHASILIQSGTIDYPTIVRGDASLFDSSATDAMICGGMVDTYSPAWEDMGGGVWRRTSTRYNVGSYTWCARFSGSETKIEQFTSIHPVATLAECQAAEDTLFLSVLGNPWTMYIHLPVGVNPQTNFLHSQYGYAFNLSSPKTRIILYCLQQLRANVTNVTHTEVRRCKYTHGNYIVNLTGDKPGNVIDRCELKHGTAGVYIFSIQGPPLQVANNVRVTGTHITDIGKEWFNEQEHDAHAIAARQGVEDYYIDGCKTERTGHPIMCYNYSWSRKCKKFVVKRTVIRAVHQHYGGPWNGIGFGPASSWQTPDWIGFDTTGNMLERCYIEATYINDPLRNGLTVDYDINDITVGWRCINNQVDGGDYGVALACGVATQPTERSSTGYIRGNVCRWQIKAFMLVAGGTAVQKNISRNGGVNSDNNVFIPGTTPPLADVVFGASQLTLAQWKAESIRFDPNSVKL